MYYIIGDIGNTSTRICLLSNKSKIIKSIIFDTKNIFFKSYTRKLFKKFSKKDLKKEKNVTIVCRPIDGNGSKIKDPASKVKKIFKRPELKQEDLSLVQGLILSLLIILAAPNSVKNFSSLFVKATTL